MLFIRQERRILNGANLIKKPERKTVQIEFKMINEFRGKPLSRFNSKSQKRLSLPPPPSYISYKKRLSRVASVLRPEGWQSDDSHENTFLLKELDELDDKIDTKFSVREIRVNKKYQHITLQPSRFSKRPTRKKDSPLRSLSPKQSRASLSKQL